MKLFFLLVPAIGLFLAACASSEPETRYVIIREATVDRQLADSAAEYCRQRGLTAVVETNDVGSNSVTFHCR